MGLANRLHGSTRRAKPDSQKEVESNGQRVQAGTKSDTKAMPKADPQQQGFLGDKMRKNGAKWPLSCGFARCRPLRRA